jgi:hypothetical protein
VLASVPPNGWFQPTDPSICERIGREWFEASRTPVVKVPSVVVPAECNYIYAHAGVITQLGIERLQYDERLWRDAERGGVLGKIERHPFGELLQALLKRLTK